MIKLKDILLEKEQVVQTDDPKKIKKLRIIFADNTKIQQVLAGLFEKIGLVTKTFNSVEDAVEYVRELKQQGVSDLEELVIGSHGTKNGLKLVKSAAGDQRSGEEFEFQDGSREFLFYDDALLIASRDLINSSTNIFFTACYGADQLSVLVHAANILGTEVYGVAGVSVPGLNRILQKFSKKIFKCKPEDWENGTSEDYLKDKVCVNTESPIKWLRVKA